MDRAGARVGVEAASHPVALGVRAVGDRIARAAGVAPASDDNDIVIVVGLCESVCSILTRYDHHCETNRWYQQPPPFPRFPADGTDCRG